MPNEPAPIRILTRRGRIASKPVVIQVAASEAGLQDQVREVMLIFALGLPLAVAVAGLGGYALARRALEPVETMTERARSITAERLADRLPVENPDDEMGRLAAVFNETLGRLQRSFEQMRQFTSDVSHELRTPLTSIRSVGEVGLRGHPGEQGYRTIIGSMLEEADRLAGLVDRLLTLSRAETGQAPLSREVVDLQALAENVVSHLSVLAEEKQQQIVVERNATPSALADRQVLRQALINLVDNAIKFTPVGGVGARAGVGDAARGRLRCGGLGPRRAAGGAPAHLRSLLPVWRRVGVERCRAGALHRPRRRGGQRRPADAGRIGRVGLDLPDFHAASVHRPRQDGLRPKGQKAEGRMAKRRAELRSRLSVRGRPSRGSVRASRPSPPSRPAAS